MTATRAAVSLAEIKKSITEAMTNADDTGRNWHYVRVWPDGSVTVGEEVSPCFPESEYYARKPHPVTVWSQQSNYSTNPEDGAREWDDCPEHEAQYWAAKSPAGTLYGRDYTDDREEHPHCTHPFKLGNWIDLDLSDTMRDVRERLEACDWLDVTD